MSHLYLSPIAQAIPDSGHGYDVVDHTRVRAEFGGDEGLQRLLDAAGDHGLGVIVDHVPNHVSVAEADRNEPWWTMLRDGRSSQAARWFDVDWDLTGGRVIVPKLGSPLDEVLAEGGLEIADGDLGPELRYGPLRFPLAEGTEDLDVVDAVARQNYELVWWRDPRRNVRRFFTIDDLVAVRVEHDDVAEAVDTLPRRLAAHPAFAGVRVDHVDGLAAPGPYLEQLRELIGDDRLLLVEKIVGPGERLPEGWPVDGTTGYEHVVSTEHTLLDPAAEEILRADWVTHESGGDASLGARSFDDLALEARREVLDDGLRPDLDRLLRAIAAASSADTGSDTVTDAGGGTGADVAGGPDDGLDDEGSDAVRRVVIAMTTSLDRYRTYLPADPASADVFDDVVAAAREMLGDDDAACAELDRVAGIVRNDPTALQRWQQLTGPAMAKGVEDRVFYRWFPLASLCEVGGEPDVFSTSVAQFHDDQRRRQADSPTAMLTETTHDTKRSGGVRARSLALAAEARRWSEISADWRRDHADVCDGIDGGLVTLALQTAVTARPITADRLEAYLVKAAREGDLVTSWTEPDDGLERRLARLASTLAGDVSRTTSDDTPLASFATTVETAGGSIGVRMAALHLTCPGFPDLYQGSPRALLSLVDPDNRRPPDWSALADLVGRTPSSDVRAALDDGDVDLARSILVDRVLHLRRRRPDVFGADAGYRELEVDGEGAEHVIAFARCSPDGEPGVVTIVTRALSEPVDASAVTVTFPDGTWRSVTHDDASLVDGGGRRLADVIDVHGVDVLDRIS